MTIQKLVIIKKIGFTICGEAIVNGVDVIFSYLPKTDKFSSICYNPYQAIGKLPEVHNQLYLVGRSIAKAINQKGA